MSTRIAALFAPLLLTLAACGGASTGDEVASTPAPASTVTVTQTATPEPTDEPTEEPTRQPAGDQVSSLKALYSELKDAGLTCDTYEVTIKNLASDCEDGTALLYYNGGSKAQDKLFQSAVYLSWSSIREQHREKDYGVLMGDNYFVRISLADATALHRDYNMGGVVLH